MNLKSFFTIFITLLFSQIGLADHPLSKIVGSQIDLYTLDHTIAGKVDEKLVYGSVSRGKGHKSSELTMEFEGQRFVAKFGQTQSGWGGSFNAPEKREMKVKLVGINMDESNMTVSFGEKTLKVLIEFDSYEDNHFVNPTYKIEFDGDVISFKLQNGRACWMYSLHLVFMIFGSYFY